VYLPFYACDVLLQPIGRQGLSRAFYHVNERFEPVFDFSDLEEDEAFLYVNYFGLLDQVVESLAANCQSLIVDNSQAFYSKPLPGVDTFYSPRKYFGVPDGSYLYTDRLLDGPLERDRSFERCEHLLRRIDDGPECAYPPFCRGKEILGGLPLRSMSKLTFRILRSINYDEVARRRIETYSTLHEALRNMNTVERELKEGQVPMVYPLLDPRKGLRDYLISRHIYVPQYWPNVLEWTEEGSLEHEYALNIVPLPIDQRYGVQEMEAIISEVRGHVGR
jgi:hypothetical protein